MKVYGECECGEDITHHTALRCPECMIKAHPGSSQCPFCMDWYYTHSGNVKKETLALHSSKKCL